jgi:hypothetical protein
VPERVAGAMQWFFSCDDVVMRDGEEFADASLEQAYDKS